MRSILSFTIEHFLLFEATLLQCAYFASAQNSAASNLSTCAGCVIHAPQTILSYTRSVSETVTSQSVTVIPYITVYENGNVTNYQTYTAYKSGAASEGIATAPPLLTWETLGTTLTYPTTYIAYPQVSAGTSARTTGQCQLSLISISLQPSDQARLIFPSTSGAQIAAITESAKTVLNSISGVAPLVAPFAPASCSKGFAAGVGATLPATATATNNAGQSPVATSAESAEAVVHTSVRYLTTEGQAVITRRGGTAPPQGQSTPPSNGGQGGNPNNPGATITWGGTTYTGKPDGSWNIGGHDLTPGGPAQTIDGTTVSVASGGSVVFNGRTTTAGTPRSSGAPQATGNAAEGQVPTASLTWVMGGAIGMLGMFVGVYL